ncbi:hypothetical protein MMC30_008163 [Trapelia coarctata]|nr:hypothetical protein [Trapelia coarctata]
MGSTIINLKISFLRSQLLILNAPLSPSPRWGDARPVPEQGELKEKLVQEAVHKLNTLLRHHNRTVYSSQSLRHVAEQIDALFWEAGAPPLHCEDADPDTVDRDADLRESETILKLPEEWVEEDVQDESGLEVFGEGTRYKTLHTRLTALAERRAATQQKLAQMKQLRQLMEPFKDAQENIQPNLVTKDGELSKELERMKVLLARVGEKMATVKRRDSGMAREKEWDEKRKVEAILEQRPIELGNG